MNQSMRLPPLNLKMSVNPYEQIVKGMRTTFFTGKTKDINYRREQLRSLLRLYEENTASLLEALQLDMRKPEEEAFLAEIGYVKRDVKFIMRNLSKWAQPTRGPRHWYTPFDKLYIRHEPYGVVLIIGPWNFVHLTLMPLAAAIAAGNCAIIKPSEVSAHCSEKLAELVPKYLDDSCYKVVVGGPEETTSLLLEKFDYIFYTGSFTIGKIIHAAANKNLTPVTLELGGKCPLYIDLTANLKMTAQRIIWGKFTNLGQACCAPDYILSTKMVQNDLINAFKVVFKEFYGEDMQKSKDFARIINARHFTRLKTMLSKTRGKVVIGGKTDEYDLWIEPTVIGKVEPTDILMKDEIFGPLLPMLTVDSIHEAVEFIRERPKPLVVYLFTKRQAVVDFFLRNTDSGEFAVNDCLYQCSVFHMPFGGVGESGMGQYHGQWSFSTFSRPRGVLHRNFMSLFNTLAIESRYPPFTPGKYKLLQLGCSLMDYLYFDIWTYVPHVICFIMGFIVMLLIAMLVDFHSHTEETLVEGSLSQQQQNLPLQ